MNMTVWARRRRLRYEMMVWRGLVVVSMGGTLAWSALGWWPGIVWCGLSALVGLRWHRITREQFESLRWKTGSMDR